MRIWPAAVPVWLLLEKHGTEIRRSWLKLHIGLDADTGAIVAAALTTNDVDDASQVGALLDQIDGPLAAFTGDGAYDRDSVYRTVTDRIRKLQSSCHPARQRYQRNGQNCAYSARRPSPKHCR